ncbi:hypothetical protein CK203_043079 [Vitis vinifera]|uniref:Uncharacterized protein n=1 Tax=Vitis vinifera TaxID=29760 RepID=A0A438GXA6_VITVI|nr:hypothetical protein CK203_043079 [Vitis vinifera]
MPLIRQKPEDCRGATVREERDDGGARAGRRVEEWGSAGLEALLRSDDVMEGSRTGWANPLEALVDSALQNEAMRYEALSSLGGLWDSGNPSLSSLLSLNQLQRGSSLIIRGIREVCQNGRESQGQGAAGTRASGSVCWDLVEFKGPLATAREQEGGLHI